MAFKRLQGRTPILFHPRRNPDPIYLFLEQVSNNTCLRTEEKSAAVNLERRQFDDRPILENKSLCVADESIELAWLWLLKSVSIRKENTMTCLTYGKVF